MTFRRVFLLPAVLLTVVLAACGNSTPQALPRLDDPKEIIEEALRTTAELEFVHARLEASTDAAGQSQSYTVDGDLNVAQREFHANVDLAGGGGMQQRAEILLVGTDMFMRTQDPTVSGLGDDRWQRIPIDAGSDPRNGIPATPAIAVALKGLLADPGISADLVGMEACGDRQCYHVTLTVDPEVTWRAVNGALLGQPGVDIGPVDPSVPEITFDVLVDEATRRLMSLSTSIEAQGQSVDLSATLSDHDVKFDLVPPPPEQVVDVNAGGGGVAATPAPMDPNVILDEVGNELEPAPTAP